MTADYLIGLTENKNHPNADLADLPLSDDMITPLKSGRVDNALLCGLAAHPDFSRLMADLEIYVTGIAEKQVQSANVLIDATRGKIIEQFNPGESDKELRQLTAAHVDEERYFRYVIQPDIDEISPCLAANPQEYFLASLPTIPQSRWRTSWRKFLPLAQTRTPQQ